jgi:hypothetical protein
MKFRAWLRRLFGLEDNLCAEFMAHFPGRCPICSYHAYGITHGYVSPLAVVISHERCPENYARWRTGR